MNKRQSQEQALFGEAPWNTLPTNRLVIPALRIRLEQLLMNHTRAEFLLVKDEIRSSLKKREELLKDLGESRSTTDQQRAYVGKIASEFMRITHYGLDAYYRRHSIFEDAEMRLITRIRSINEAFAHVMYQKGHARDDNDSDNDSGTDSSISAKGDEVDRSSLYDDEVHFEIPKLHEGDLRGIVSGPYRCPEPETDRVLLHMSADQLNSIAAEDQAVKEKRERH
ncbi:uncharacterized protein TrAFT101_009725 [Trichoderma asperellum]|uniref:uncharacterized protein n=1 Tax=Trichoderma asperellum TaxID=101201 RepID=UPI00332FD82C|nr:hypothetical protein TrAFT101_009725 [Trichoderma asperellum]